MCVCVCVSVCLCVFVSMCLCVHTFKQEYHCNIFAVRNQILSEGSLGWVKNAIGFGLDWVRILVSIVSDRSHRVTMGKML